MTPLTRLRRWYWRNLRNHDGEVCMDCGRPVITGTGAWSWWEAPDDLWLKAWGRSDGLLCPADFTRRLFEQGQAVHWKAVAGS